MKKVEIVFCSDILCVWAYIGQVRLDELLGRHTQNVHVDSRFMSVFGDVPRKIENSWNKRGGIQGYNAHVQDVAKNFPEIDVHPECWTQDTPASSMPAHLYLRAIHLLTERQEAHPNVFPHAIRSLRRRFFVEAQNIATVSVLTEMLEEVQVPMNAAERLVRSGEAFAELSNDLDLAKAKDIKTSPTFAFNEWRQRLQGNVGYRLIEANIAELLGDMHHFGASWC